MSEIDVPEIQEPIKHQLAKLVIGTVVGFAATKLSAIVYDAVLEHYSKEEIIEDITV